MRDAEARALAESGLGSGLLARQKPADAESVAVLKVCLQCGKEYETAARFCPNDGTSLRPKDSDSVVGRVLADRYHILKRIGEGGMGRVYLGEHVKMSRQCAIKVMSPALVNDSESAARFAREASNAARIIHPNVAAVFDYGESDGLVYLVMEFVDGEPLSRLLAREAPLAVDRALDLARQIADGLGAAHELGIVHRDLKPDNILVMRTRAGKEVAKVVDFGIAKAIQEGSADPLTRTGLVIGTPEFMSPEQLLGDPIDARSDLYALGCILHLMLIAAPSFAAPTREQMIKRRLSEDAPHLQTIDPGIPDSLDMIVARLLARSPVDRYGSAADVRDALAGTHARRARPERPARLTPRSAPTVAFESAAQATTQVTPVDVAPAARGRRSVVALAGFALATVAVAIALRGRDGDAVADEQARQSRDSTLRASSAAALEQMRANDSLSARANPAVLMVDSARLLAKRQEADSLAKREADIGGARAAIILFRRAVERANSAALNQDYPMLTGQQQNYWRNLDGTARVKAGVRYLATSVRRDTAQVYFVMNVSVERKAGESPTTLPPKRQHATVVRRGRSWQIVALRDQ